MAKSSNQNQSIEALKQRFEKLNKEQAVLQDRRQRADNDLAELQRQAREQFGTDDLEKLESRLAEMKQQNEKQTIEYQKQLDAIDEQLANIDESFDTEKV